MFSIRFEGPDKNKCWCPKRFTRAFFMSDDKMPYWLSCRHDDITIFHRYYCATQKARKVWDSEADLVKFMLSNPINDYTRMSLVKERTQGYSRYYIVNLDTGVETSLDTFLSNL